MARGGRIVLAAGLSMLAAPLLTAGCAPSSDTSGGGSGSSDAGTTFQVDARLDDAALTPDNGCLTTSMRSTLVPTTLVFQIDLSASMNCLPTEDPSVTPTCVLQEQPGSRWNLLRDALETAVGLLPADDGVGLLHFPLWPTTPQACVPAAPDVAIGPVAKNQLAVGVALAKLTPLGGTPTHDALIAAYDALRANGGTGNRYVVLATDGAASYCAGCVASCDLAADARALVQLAADALANDAIHTYVIGVPGSEEYRAVLSRLAAAGGTGTAGCTSGDITSAPTVGDCHVDMTTSASDFGTAVGAALAAISGHALSCEYDIPDADAGTFDPTTVNVRFTDGATTVDFPRDPSHQTGWDYTADQRHIQLHGDACVTVEGSQTGTIDIVYGCPTKTVH